MACASSDFAVRVWNLADGACLRTFKGHSADVTSLDLIDRHTLVSASSDQTIRLWNLTSGAAVVSRPSILTGHTASVRIVKWMASERTLARLHGPLVECGEWRVRANSRRSHGPGAEHWTD